MEDTSIETTSGKRKRGRPRTYSTTKAKAAADVKRKRAARQDASHAQRNVVHTSFYQPVASLQAADVSNGFHILADSTNIPPPEERDISQFLAAVDYQLEEGVQAQVTLDDGTPAGAVDSSPPVDYIGPDLDEAIGFDAPHEPSPQPEDDERGPVEHLTQKLAEQLTRFQGCCNDCHQTAKECRIQSSAEQISLAQYLESTAGLGADVLSSMTLAGGEDDLARKVNAECRKKIFCGVDSESEAPLICLDKDEKVSRTAGVTFDVVDSIIGFPSSLSVAKRGIRWSPTRMTVSDLQSDLHLRSFPVTYFDAEGVQRQVHRPGVKAEVTDTKSYHMSILLHDRVARGLGDMMSVAVPRAHPLFRLEGDDPLDIPGVLGFEWVMKVYDRGGKDEAGLENEMARLLLLRATARDGKWEGDVIIPLMTEERALRPDGRREIVDAVRAEGKNRSWFDAIGARALGWSYEG
ncbi:hypothetical protein TGAM01_v211022 [Trichoderma gamsii]|uniref:Uncharacterized protein n=1 Tax=Trichoderma gamsii TaxID=398673 RepID=A0A2P4Z746_9HYPO|nr:hypothetical protein TGAM01_v211022 [Trichoderma gamsii]PON20099.1 hypothetical protein TGAM01_v211022 [Trichoderma gamsii]